MDLPIVGAAWPQEHRQLEQMARVLGVAMRIQRLGGKPFIKGQA
jgi:hypothetical protein